MLGAEPLSAEGTTPEARLVHKKARSAYLNNSAQVTARKPRAPLYPYREWVAFAGNALMRGAVAQGPYKVRWDASGRCQSPVYREIKGRAYYGMPSGRSGKESFQAEARENQNPTAYLDMWVPCRRCAVCLRRRANHWKLRAMTELKQTDDRGGRTWFCTLTLDEGKQFQVELAVRARVGSSEFEAMSPEHRFGELAREAGKLVTLWLKRVREKTGAGLRYLLVCEAHKSGKPHYHLLVHEADREKPVRWRDLSDTWVQNGFFHGKIVNRDTPVSYVTKYLSKDARSRVRASVGYGQGDYTPLHSGLKGQREETLTPFPFGAGSEASVAPNQKRKD